MLLGLPAEEPVFGNAPQVSGTLDLMSALVRLLTSFSVWRYAQIQYGACLDLNAHISWCEAQIGYPCRWGFERLLL